MRDLKETGALRTEREKTQDRELHLAELGWGMLMTIAIVTALLATGVFTMPKPLESMHSRIGETILCFAALFLAWRIVRKYGVEASRHD